MSLRIKNGKLLILAACLIALFTRLGFWQLSRATQKEQLLAQFQERQKQTPLVISSLQTKKDIRFYRAELQGEFDNTHTFLLDNKIFQGQVGYEVYTPFIIDHSHIQMLIDRGFIPHATPRAILPIVPAISGKHMVIGLLNLPPTYVAFGPMQDNAQTTWPMRIEFIHLQTISQLLHQPFYNYVLQLAPNTDGAFDIAWQIVTIQPERHRGYALQWFAFALTLVVLSVALNWAPSNKYEENMP